jgi:hypothetical protein
MAAKTEVELALAASRLPSWFDANRVQGYSSGCNRRYRASLQRRRPQVSRSLRP